MDETTSENELEFRDWVKRIDSCIMNAQDVIRVLFRFDSDVEAAEYWRRLSMEVFATGKNDPRDHRSRIHITVHCFPDDFFRFLTNLGQPPEIYLQAHYPKQNLRVPLRAGESAERFLLQFGASRIDFARETCAILENIKKTARIIRRNILYPEFEELEAKAKAKAAEESASLAELNAARIAIEHAVSLLGTLGDDVTAQRRRIDKLEDVIATAATDVWNSRNFLGVRSKKLGGIREDLMDALPEEKREKLCLTLGVAHRGKVYPPQPWPEPEPEERPEEPPNAIFKNEVFSANNPR